ncbi:MAG: alpha/beta hydrolase [Anaerolineae bacterium]|nr:alpha/beta hydrolase [Anaerolineae bacterium]
MSQPVSILGSEMQLLNSQQTGRQYRITISLPWGYEAQPGESWPFNNIPEKWPVVYVLDGNWYSGLITDMIRPTALCGGISDAIVVGIGYPETGTPIEVFRQVFTRRDHDLTPIVDSETRQIMEAGQKRPVPNGDAGNFLMFIQQELIPFIEKGYHADPTQRILVGHSYGGLFGLYALFTVPDLFQKMILGSPTLSYGKRYLFQREEIFATEGKTPETDLYLFVSAEEESANDATFTDTMRFAAILEGRGYPHLMLVKKIFTDQNHCEVAAPGFQWGLKQVLKK